MKTICMALIAYLLLTGLALLWSRLLRLSLAEGMLPGTACVAAVLYAAGMAGHFTIGIYALAVLGIAGFCLSAAQDALRRERWLTAQLWSPHYVCLSLLFLGSVLLYYGDFIWHIDEFHLYAGAPKYMLEYGRLPLDVSYIPGAGQYLSTSLFHFFFQYFTGYHEGVMYVSAALLAWIGFLLPFGGDSTQSLGWKETFLYTCLLYVGIYSLYVYGTKNLYVDLPAAAWAGGIAAGWMLREHHTKGQVLAAGIGLLLVCLFKPQVGALLALLVVCFLLAETLRKRASASSRIGRSGGAMQGGRVRRVILLAAAALLLGALGLILFVWAAGGSRIGMGAFASSMRTALRERLRPTTIAYLSALAGTALSTRSALKLTLPFMAVLAGTLFVAGGTLRKERGRGRLYAGYGAAALLVYLAALYGAFLFIFSYEESVKVAGIRRYFSDILLFLLVIALVWLLSARRAKARYMALGLLLFFLLGLNEHYVPNMTAIDKAGAAGYKDIKRTRQQAKEIGALLRADDRVYFLNQGVDNEYPVNAALYYLEGQVSNYLSEPWKLTEKGSMIRLEETETPSIADFSDLLREGGYTYLWVYSTDSYAQEAFRDVLGYDGLEAGLYRTDWTEDGQLLLEQVLF